MNEPIISPWLFYWMGLCDPIFIISIMFLLFGGITLCFFTKLWFEDEEKLLPHFYAYLTIWIFLLMVCVFVPSKDTLYKMVIAQNITYERVGKAVDVGKELHNTIKQDVLDIIREVTKEKEKK